MNITIADIAIRQDVRGRFSLNDLHRAAGGQERHRPSRWAENQQTVELAAEIDAEGKAGIPALVLVHGGAAPGTFVVRELVYSYAMWISPAFHLQVIRSFDASQAARVPTVPQTLAQALRLAADQAEELERARPAVQFVERYVEAPTGSLGFRQVAKLLRANEARFREFLEEHRVLYRLGGTLAPYQNHVDAGRFEIRAGVASNEHAYTRALFTPKGVQWVAGLWIAEQARATA
jgi:phage antirepressor YoqD-like protein